MVEGRGRVDASSPIVYRLIFRSCLGIVSRTSIRNGLERALAEENRIVERVRAQAYIAEAHSPDRIGEDWERVIANDRGEAHGWAPRACRPRRRRAPRPLRLNLGCGDKILPGYVNVDVVECRAGMKSDVICDLHA